MLHKFYTVLPLQSNAVLQTLERHVRYNTTSTANDVGQAKSSIAIVLECLVQLPLSFMCVLECLVLLKGKCLGLVCIYCTYSLHFCACTCATV